MGHHRTFRIVRWISALPLKADVGLAGARCPFRARAALVLENEARGRAMRQQASVVIGGTSFSSPNPATAIQNNAFRLDASYFWLNGPKK